MKRMGAKRILTVGAGGPHAILIQRECFIDGYCAVIDRAYSMVAFGIVLEWRLPREFDLRKTDL